MITTRNMEISDFLSVMAQNEAMYPEFAELPEEAKRYVANINVMTGTANTYLEDGEIVGVGGIRYVGIGEGWLITPPLIREERKFLILRQAKKDFEKTRKSKNLWRVFAETRISEIFLKHLGFKKSENTHVWTGI